MTQENQSTTNSNNATNGNGYENQDQRKAKASEPKAGRLTPEQMESNKNFIATISKSIQDFHVPETQNHDTVLLMLGSSQTQEDDKVIFSLGTTGSAGAMINALGKAMEESPQLADMVREALRRLDNPDEDRIPEALKNLFEQLDRFSGRSRR